MKVTHVQLLDKGGDQDWSPQNVLAYDKLDANKVYQLYTVNMATLQPISLYGPMYAVDKHKVAPCWHPSCEWLVAQIEMSQHPLSLFHTQSWISEWIENGLWCDLWALHIPTGIWTQLTKYSNQTANGSMAPHFDSTGTKLTWSEMIAPHSQAHPYGVYRLRIADWQVSNDIPSLIHVQDITPDGANFIEAHGFDPRDNNIVLFTSDIGSTSMWTMNLFTWNMATQRLNNLTNSPVWNEHGSYSPNGSNLIYMNSIWLGQCELFLAGSSDSPILVPRLLPQQLTFFNRSSAPEYIVGGAIATRSSWSPDGSQIALTVQYSSSYPQRGMYLLTLDGNYE